MSFPSVDPIPIPAPVWLMKVLSLLTLALHFVAVMMLVGSLILVCWHNYHGRAKKDSDQLSAANVLARRLPVIMTYVINLGIPPLLFTQVLYGRALYTSSVLMAVLWFSVILQLMLAYWLLYLTNSRIEAGKAAWPMALLALLVTLGIGQIYSMNMTLMLRPEAWAGMYAAHPNGLQAPTGDPTMMPRWLFVMAGGLLFGGLWAILLANMGHLGDRTKGILRRSGGALASTGAVLQISCAVMVVSKQPEAVRTGLQANGLYTICGYLFLATTLAAGLAALVSVSRKGGLALSIGGIVLAFLGTAGSVIYRDGIRDVTLLGKGFDVWKRTEASNWSVIAVFLLLFVIMLVIIAWLLSVMRRATPPNEQVAL